MLNKGFKKGLAIAVVVLFIGFAFAPSINANVSKDGLVEFTTEVCGLNGDKKTVKLTQQQAKEVEDLFDSIREKLNTTKSREGAEEIFKDAVVELDKYDLLGGLSVKQALRLVTGGYDNPRLKMLYEVFQTRTTPFIFKHTNVFCLTYGKIESEDFFNRGLIELFLAATMMGSMFLLLGLFGIAGFFMVIPIFMAMGISEPGSHLHIAIINQEIMK